MSLVGNIREQFEAAKKKGWDKIFFAFDIHSTIIRPNYEVGNIPTEFYPLAKETLQEISDREDVDLIIYTCSWPKEIEEYLKYFESHGINFKYVNENPEVKNQGYGFYDKKFYFNVLIEDKAGFNAEKDWDKFQKCMKSIPILPKPTNNEK